MCIEAHRAELAELCHRFHVARLELFGSAVTDRFDPDTSDLDFLVVFQATLPQGSARGAAFLDLWDVLEQLFGCSVDLVEVSTLRNPYLLRVIARSRTLLYVA